VEAETGEIGQIGGRGASLMLGYFDDQQATENSFNAGGWFMTGDLGRLDANGYLKITGRKKEVIIRGGHNIYPARIEALAMRHPAIERVAAVPVRDARLGEKVCLAVMSGRGSISTVSKCWRISTNPACRNTKCRNTFWRSIKSR
jgi:acyl-CoA synthetase